LVLAVVLGFIWAFARGILNLPERLTLSSRRRRQASPARSRPRSR
jgi:HemY protein